jgi:hypothetical protein
MAAPTHKVHDLVASDEPIFRPLAGELCPSCRAPPLRRRSVPELPHPALPPPLQLPALPLLQSRRLRPRKLHRHLPVRLQHLCQVVDDDNVVTALEEAVAASLVFGDGIARSAGQPRERLGRLGGVPLKGP